MTGRLAKQQLGVLVGWQLGHFAQQHNGGAGGTAQRHQHQKVRIGGNDGEAFFFGVRNDLRVPSPS